MCDWGYVLIEFMMYTLLYGLYKHIIQKDEFCVLILGLDNAGKTVRKLSKPVAFDRNFIP